MRGLIIAALTGLLLGGGTGSAAAQEKDAFTTALERAMIAPEIVFKYAGQIKLTAEQRRTIVEAVKDVQGDLVGLQLEMAEPAQELLALLAPTRVDEAAVLAKIDRLLTAERDVKKLQMRLLIRIRNALTAEQQDRLRRLRDGASGDANDGDAPHGSGDGPEGSR